MTGTRVGGEGSQTCGVCPLQVVSQIASMSVLTNFLLLRLLLVLLHTGSLDSFLVIGHIPAPTLPLVLRVGELLLTRYPLIGGTDWRKSTSLVFTVTQRYVLHTFFL